MRRAGSLPTPARFVRASTLLSLALVPPLARAQPSHLNIAPGVTYDRRVFARGPRRSPAHVVTVDLCQPGVSLRVSSPAEGGRSVPAWGRLVGAVTAVNGDYFEGRPPRPLGPSRGDGRWWPHTPREHRDALVGFGPAGHVEVFPPQDTTRPALWVDTPRWLPAEFTEVLAAREQVLAAGVVRTSPFVRPQPGRHPRTALGLSADRHTLWLVVVEGRRESASGVTAQELGELLRELGARDGFKLDGGGSSTLFVRGRGVLNRPSDGAPRAVANHLGVLVGPEAPGTARCPSGTAPTEGGPSGEVLTGAKGHDPTGAMEATASSPTAPKVNLRAVVPLALLFLGSVAAIFSPAGAGSTGGHAPDTGDTAWMLTASALVLLMTPGLSFFYGGMVRPKNIISTMLQSFIAMGVVSLLWVVVGFSLAFGRSLGGIVGDPRTFFMFQGVRELTDPDLSPTVPLLLFALFQLKFAIITPALVSGSFAERVRFSAYLLFIALFTVVVYCPLAHATWHPQGLLHRYGLLDFAGGTVVHMSAGIAALAGARFLGKRVDYEPGQPHPPAHVPYVLLGTGMLWFGWFGFNAGSALTASPTAAHAFLTTNTASAAAMLAWMLLERVRGLRPSALGACIGAVVGLVAITPAAGFVAVGPSIFIGVTAAVVSTYAVHLKTRSTLDDTLDVFPCHGVGGIVGMLLTGVFADQRVNSAGTNGLFQGNPELFWKHLLAVPALCVLVFCAAWMLYKLTDLVVPLRVSPEHETQGLDLSQHGESASLPREQH